MKRALLALRTQSLMTVAALIAAVSLPSSSFSCGFHLQDVFVQRVGLNIVYPDAMHVMAAISTAQLEKRLPTRVSAAGTADLFAYQRTVKMLERLGKQLAPDAPSFSLVLIEQMLWMRFDLDGGVRMQVHVSAPQPGELVMVSDDVVISEIVNARLGIDEARRRGLIRLYGPEAQIARLLAAFEKMTHSSATDG
jgi:hypothetical protein